MSAFGNDPDSGPRADEQEASPLRSARRALVTGGCGFIGSHLVEELIRHGIDVVVLDDLATGRESNISGPIASGKCELVVGSVCDPTAVSEAMDTCDYVFHLAALADLVPSIERPFDYYQTNVHGTVVVMEAARDRSIRKLVYTASSSSYGIPTLYPTPETSPCRPEHPYALTKWLAEEVVLHWSRVYSVPAVSLRLFNVYGPRARTTGTYGAVFGVFLAQRLAGRPLTIVGSGTQTRDFTHVRDVARALVLAAKSSLTATPLNVGSGGTYPILAIAEMIGGERIHLPKRPGEPDVTFADISRIRESLSWSAEISLEEGVSELISMIQEWRDAPVWERESIAAATQEWFRRLESVH